METMFDRAALHDDAWSWERALSLALASQLAYHGAHETMHTATATWGFERCVPLEAGQSQAFVAWDAGCVVIAYRGTASLGDWLGNLDVRQAGRPYGSVHRGFLEGFVILRGPVEAALAAAGLSGKRIWLTGHSLGGALAAIAGAELGDALPIAGFYTYGQPKPFWPDAAGWFTARFEGRLHRFVNDDDLVPGIPPLYRHVGELIWFDGAGGLKARETGSEVAGDAEAAGEREPAVRPHEMSMVEFEAMQEEIRRVAEAVQTVEEATGAAPPAALDASLEGLFPSIRDHAIERYVDLIRRQLDPAPGRVG